MVRALNPGCVVMLTAFGILLVVCSVPARGQVNCPSERQRGQLIHRHRLPRSKTAAECFNLGHGGQVDGHQDNGFTVHQSWFAGCNQDSREGANSSLQDEPQRQLVFLTCADRSSALAGAYTAYLQAAILSVAGLLHGVTQVCYVSGSRHGRALVPPPSIEDDKWMYQGDLVPRMQASQWIVDYSCKDSPVFKDVSKLKNKLARAADALALNDSTRDVKSLNNSWWSGVFWNEHAQLVSVRHRPLLMQWKGEVFWGANYGSCEECDVVVYRAKTHPSSKCLSLHFVNGIAHFSTRLRNNVTDLLASLPDRTEHTKGPAKELALVEAAKTLASKKHFCAFVSNSCFKSMYEPEAMVRVLFFDMISKQHKQCHGLGNCRKTEGMHCDANTFANVLPRSWDHNTDIAAACFADYKFVISMDNQKEEGYLTEKIYNAFLAPSIPIYFGAPDVAQYINTEAIVLCDISPDKFAAMRKHWIDNRVKSQMRSGKMTEEQVLEYGMSLNLEEDLQACVDQVIRIDQSDDLYMDMISRPILPISYRNSIVNTHYDGGTLANGLLEVLKTLDSPLLDDQDENAQVLDNGTNPRIKQNSSDAVGLPGRQETSEPVYDTVEGAIKNSHSLPKYSTLSSEQRRELKKELILELKKELKSETSTFHFLVSMMMAVAVGVSWSGALKAMFSRIGALTTSVGKK